VQAFAARSKPAPKPPLQADRETEIARRTA
jgi:hypothetical protein